MSTTIFESFSHWLDEVEGGFTNDPHGGPTYAGIQQQELTKWLLGQPPPFIPMTVQQLSERHEIIDAIRLGNYWLPMRVYDLLPAAACALVCFDGAVNQGVPTMIRLLQDALQVAMDGDFGPITLRSYRAQVGIMGGDLNMAMKLIRLRRERYIELDDPRNERGWMNRLDLLERRIQTETHGNG